MNNNLNVTGMKKLPKCAEEVRDAAFCKKRDNVYQVKQILFITRADRIMT